MKANKLVTFLFLLVLVFAVVSPAAALSAPVAQEEAPTFWSLLRDAGDALKGMVFVGIFCSTLVGYLKSKFIVKDDDVMTVLTAMSLSLVLIFAVIKYFSPSFNLLVFEDYAKLIVDSSGAWTPVALLIINVFSKVFYSNVLRGLPVIGFSYSKAKEKFDPPLDVKVTK